MDVGGDAPVQPLHRRVPVAPDDAPGEACILDRKGRSFAHGQDDGTPRQLVPKPLQVVGVQDFRVGRLRAAIPRDVMDGLRGVGDAVVVAMAGGEDVGMVDIQPLQELVQVAPRRSDDRSLPAHFLLSGARQDDSGAVDPGDTGTKMGGEVVHAPQFTCQPQATSSSRLAAMRLQRRLTVIVGG